MLRPGIVLLDADTLGETSFYRLTQLGNLTVYPHTSGDQRIERMAGNEIVITNKVVIDRQVMDACPSIRLICIAATGMNNVDLEYASQKGIVVKNVTGYSTESVVQHTFAMLFYVMESLPYYDTWVKSGKYASNQIFTHHTRAFHELSGKVFGIAGLGTIGKRVAQVASGFGASVIYYSTSGKNKAAGYRNVSLEELLGQSDVLSVHAPLNKDTRNLIGYRELSKMKKNAVLINAGRGGIINEADLARALDEKLIAGAALDVLEKEPPDASNPLLYIVNKEALLITPHLAWASVESRQRLTDGIIQNINAFLSTQAL